MGKLKETIGTGKDMAKDMVRYMATDKDFRNEMLVEWTKSILIGYGIGSLLSDIRDGRWSRK